MYEALYHFIAERRVAALHLCCDGCVSVDGRVGEETVGAQQPHQPGDTREGEHVVALVNTLLPEP